MRVCTFPVQVRSPWGHRLGEGHSYFLRQTLRTTHLTQLKMLASSAFCQPIVRRLTHNSDVNPARLLGLTPPPQPPFVSLHLQFMRGMPSGDLRYEFVCNVALGPCIYIKCGIAWLPPSRPLYLSPPPLSIPPVSTPRYVSPSLSLPTLSLPPSASLQKSKKNNNMRAIRKESGGMVCTSGRNEKKGRREGTKEEAWSATAT